MSKRNIHKLFDYLGFPAFLYLFIDALRDVVAGHTDLRVTIRLLIVGLGMIIDGYLIFIHKENKGS